MRWLASVCLFLVTWVPAWADEAPATPDAALRAIHMADAREGWAVGDDGLVLHTMDGWQTWEQQRTNVRLSLRSVHFVDAFIGYIVGCEPLPFGRGTGGVVLKTTDGGVSWKKLIHREMPGLTAVRFLDEEVGFAFGDTNGGHPGGLFRTENGGQTWKPCAALASTPGWTAGTLMHEQPVAVGPGAVVGLYEKEQVLPVTHKGMEQICLNALGVSDQDVWAVGTHATVMLSRQTGGKSFEPMVLPLSPAVSNQLDFNAVACKGDHVWIAGRPGSVVYHSPDRGKTWEVQRTGQPLPVHALCFASESVGFAMGELGTILSTRDAGKTWQLMRRGGHRTAVMAVTAQGQQMPLGTIAYVGGDQGYLTVGVQAACEPGQWRSDVHRLTAAMRAVGGTSCDVFTRMIVADYQQHMPAGKLMELAEQQKLLEQLVLALRMWRPSVVICEATDGKGTAGPLGAVIAMTLRKACDLSGKADVFPEQLTKLGLEPWQPSRLFTQRTAGNPVDCTVDLDLPRPVLFASANDFAGLARPMLFDQYVRGPEREVYTLWKNWKEPFEPYSPFMVMLRGIGPLGCLLPTQSTPHEDLMLGISLNHGGQARREKVEVDYLRYQLLLGATHRQKLDAKPYLDKLYDETERKQFFTNFENSINGLAPLTQGDRIFAQAQEYVNRGQWTMARECHLLLLDMMPTHRLAPESSRFIATMMGSSEIRRRVEMGKMPHFVDYVLRSPGNKNDGTKFSMEGMNLKQRTVLQRYRTELRRWNGGTLAASSIYSVLHPLGYGDPDLQFCLMASERSDQTADQGNLRQMAFQMREPSGMWYDAAQAEQWLSLRTGVSPKPTMQALRARSMPKLDGKLDDEIWKTAPVTVLQNAAGKATVQTRVQMAYDDTYLYLGVTCQQPAGLPVMQPVKPRKRDDDLRQFDRMSLLLDLDRDYGSAFHLEWDARGCVMEECFGDMSWNPQWFVEVNPTSDGWTSEIAIPLVELTGLAKLDSEVWAVNVSRIIPGQGVQAMSLPAGVKPQPRGMGLLLFSQAP
ncbi:MAG: YCF48-related protein [Gemmatales bacterium]